MADDNEPELRREFQIHPAAAGFRMMSDAELKELAEDIKAHGLRKPIVLFRRWAAQQASEKTLH
jgi:hypothetical protein